MNSFADLTLTEIFQTINSFHRIRNLPTKMNFDGNNISGSLTIANAFNQNFAND